MDQRLRNLALAAGWTWLILFATPVGHEVARTADQALALGTYARPNGSGDTAFRWLVAGVAVVGALVAGAAAAATRRVAPRWAGDGLVEGARLFLGTKLILYGLAKTVGTQMPAPSIVDLTVPLGEISPMRLMWTFIGFSPTYQAFTGAAELVFGVLLLSRRTALLGALGALGVMSNVFLMNLCYDVPVKLLSGAMLAVSTALLAVEGRPLVAFFFTGQPVPARALRPDLAGRAAWQWRAGKLFATGVLVVPMLLGVSARPQRAQSPEALAGLWQVSDGPPGWERVAFDSGGIAVLSDAGPSWAFAVLAGDRLTLRQRDAVIGWLDVATDGDDLVLTGEIHGRPRALRLTARRTLEQMPINARGFRWVSDRPWNTHGWRGSSLDPP